MAYEHKEGQRSLFKNAKQNDCKPDYKGTVLINGITCPVPTVDDTSASGGNAEKDLPF